MSTRELQRKWSDEDKKKRMKDRRAAHDAAQKSMEQSEVRRKDIRDLAFSESRQASETLAVFKEVSTEYFNDLHTAAENFRLAAATLDSALAELDAVYSYHMHYFREGDDNDK